MGDLGTRLACTFWDLIASETLKDLKPTPCEAIWILESLKFLKVVSGLLGFGILNAAQGVLDPESTAWNPESNTVLDSLTWSDRVMPGAFGIVEGLVTLLSEAL